MFGIEPLMAGLIEPLMAGLIEPLMAGLIFANSDTPVCTKIYKENAKVLTLQQWRYEEGNNR